MDSAATLHRACRVGPRAAAAARPLALLAILLAPAGAAAQARAPSPGAAAYKRALPSLVKIETPTSTGSGFICSRDGKVVTNYHVVRHAARLDVWHLKYDRYDARYRQVKILAVDPVRDIAVLQIPGFRGFREADIPLDVRPGTARDDLPPGGTEVYALTNPATALGVMTQGQASRSSIQDALPARRVDYDVLLFSAEVYYGSSGGPVLDAASHEVVGITTGAAVQVGVLAFAVPATYLNLLLDRSRGMAATTPPWPEREAELPADTDGYYAARELAANRDKPPEIQTVSGIVYSEESLPVQGAFVDAYSRPEPNRLLHAVASPTDVFGNYSLALPVTAGQAWRITVRHPSFEEESRDLTELPLAPIDFPLKLRQGLVREVAVFDAKPIRVELRRQAAIVLVRSFVLGPSGVQERHLPWSLSTDPDLPRWLEVAPRQGRATGSGQMVTLRYVAAARTDAAQEVTQIGFVGTAGNACWIDVFADAPPDRQLLINGFVIKAGGGALGETILVRALVGGTRVRQTWTDSSGRFSLWLPASHQGAEVRLEIDSLRWRPTAEEVFRLDEPEKELIIQVVAR
jgi:S1-C subfamily serine protease